MTPDEWIEQLRASSKVSYVSRMRDGTTVIAHSRDVELVNALRARGAHIRWFDRTEFSTQKGAEPDMQAEINLGPRFWQRAEASA